MCVQKYTQKKTGTSSNPLHISNKPPTYICLITYNRDVRKSVKEKEELQPDIRHLLDQPLNAPSQMKHREK